MDRWLRDSSALHFIAHRADVVQGLMQTLVATRKKTRGYLVMDRESSMPESCGGKGHIHDNLGSCNIYVTDVYYYTFSCDATVVR